MQTYVLILCSAGLLTSSIAGVAAQSSSDDASEATDAPPQSQPQAGHSLHGEAFNEGPRQHAYLMPESGRVAMEITTSDPVAQEYFLQGVGMLHGFWYFEAERAFRHAAFLDPDCAMAYWGMAFANRDHLDRARELIGEAKKRKANANEREALWIDAFARFFEKKNEDEKKKNKNVWRRLVRDLEKIIHEYPDEIEARAFLGWALWQASYEGLEIQSHQAVDALLADVIAANPQHPGAHHYTVHLWDNEKAERAVWAAAGIGPSAPAIAHMWHMAGHIYAKLNRHGDAAWQQQASARVDHAYMMRDRVMPYLIHNYAHNQEWCIRSLSHVGEVSHAIDLARNLIELPRHPKFNTLEKSNTCAAYGRRRLIEVLLKFELWDELIGTAETVYLEPTELRSEQGARLFALAIARFALGDVAGADDDFKSVKALVEDENAARDAYVAAAETKAKEDENNDEDDIKRAKKDAERRFARQQKALENYVAELEVNLALADGEHDTAKKLLGKNKAMPAERKARAWHAVGELSKALEVSRKAVEKSPNRVVPLASYIELLAASGDESAAAEQFSKLRTLAGKAELNLPTLRRLAPFAERLGLPEDWRTVAASAEDLGPRPQLDSLGPLLWEPLAAPAWELPTADGATVSLADYRGRPVVIIFYLGLGCLHCVEQLEAFAPMAEAYADAGIELVGISTDGEAKLQESEERFSSLDSGRGFPFPLVSDSEFDVFKAYRAYDDFESMPLHGTFLVDGDGLVRWQDISYEPFTEPGYLLDEALRLIAQEDE